MLGLVAVAFGCGTLLSTWLGIRYRSFLELASFAIGMGLVFFSVAGFVIGVAHGLSLISVLIFGLLAICLAFFGFRSISDVTRPDTTEQGSDRTLLMTVPMVYVGMVLLAGLLTALSPELVWDAHSYHLDVAKRWVEAGGMIYVPYIFYSNWPLGMSAVYALEMALARGSTLPQLTEFMFIVLTLLLVWSYTRRKFGSHEALLSIVIIASTPVLAWLMGSAITDLAVAYFFVAGAIAVLIFVDEPSPRWLVVAGIMAGGALETKLTGILGFVALWGMVIWVHVSEASLRRKLLANIAIFSLVSLAIVFPWYLKSFLQTGDPVFPFGFALFHGKFWPAEVNQRFLAEQFNYMGAHRNLLGYLSLPVRLLLDQSKVLEGPISWVYPAGFLLGLLHWRRRETFGLVLFVALYFILWSRFSSQVVRMLLPALVVLAVLFAAHTLKILRQLGIERWGLPILLAGVVIEGLARGWLPRLPMAREQIEIQAGTMSREQYLMRHFDLAAPVALVNGLPKDGALLAYNDERGYLVDREFIWGHPDLQGYLDYARLNTRSLLEDRLDALGVKYIMINRNNYPTQAKDLEPIFADMTLLKSFGSVDIFAFNDPH